MTTIEKLAAYRRTLERYKSRKQTYDANEAVLKKPQKPFAEVYPLPESFELPKDDVYALKIHADVMKNKVGVPVRRTKA